MVDVCAHVMYRMNAEIYLQEYRYNCCTTEMCALRYWNCCYYCCCTYCVLRTRCSYDTYQVHTKYLYKMHARKQRTVFITAVFVIRGLCNVHERTQDSEHASFQTTLYCCTGVVVLDSEREVHTSPIYCCI